METPVLSDNPGYTLTAAQALSFTKTSTTLLSMNILSFRGSSTPISTAVVSGGLDSAPGNKDE